MNEIPRSKNILILAEGFEEKPYIDKILSFPNINKDAYRFGNVINVKGNGNIVYRYQYEIQRGFYDLILTFCDADNGSEQFLQLVNQIGEEFFKCKEDGLNVFIFSNPVTLQIVLSHFGDVNLQKSGKKLNADEVERLTGIKDYDAKQEQIELMINQIRFNSIDALKERLKRLSTDVRDVPSTNFLMFLERFENPDSSWIDEINKLRK